MVSNGDGPQDAVPGSPDVPDPPQDAVPSAPDEAAPLTPRWGLAEAIPAWVASAFFSILIYGGVLAAGDYSPFSPQRPGGHIGRAVGQFTSGVPLRNDAVPVIWRMATLVPGWIVMLAVAWFLASITGKEKRGWDLRGKASDIPLGIGAGVFIQVPVLTIVGILMTLILGDFTQSGRAQELVDSLNSPFAYAALILGVAVGAPVVEELFYRGIIQGSLVEKLGDIPGLILASIIFGAVHLSWIEFIPLTVAGLGFGLLALKTGRLLPAIIAHMAFNAVTLVFLFATV